LVSNLETATHAWRDWALQRLTAVAALLGTLGFIVMVATAPPINYSTWRQTFLPLWVKYLALLFFISLYLHAWIGMRNIVMDYVKNARGRQTLYTVIISMLGIYVMWTVRILWGPQ
jgi:succinate dehydrogenase / fumarate reductase membrane anchor subunit